MARLTPKGKQVTMSQTNEVPITLIAILRDPEFRAGVEDARAGRPARFDAFHDYGYEHGRQFAFVAPMTLTLCTKGRVNPQALPSSFHRPS
jgi:hypothetical protein